MADEILTPEQVGDLRRQYLGTRPLLDSHEALRAERDEARREYGPDLPVDVKRCVEQDCAPGDTSDD